MAGSSVIQIPMSRIDHRTVSAVKLAMQAINEVSFSLSLSIYLSVNLSISVICGICVDGVVKWWCLNEWKTICVRGFVFLLFFLVFALSLGSLSTKESQQTWFFDLHCQRRFQESGTASGDRKTSDKVFALLPIVMYSILDKRKSIICELYAQRKGNWKDFVSSLTVQTAKEFLWRVQFPSHSQTVNWCSF